MTHIAFFETNQGEQEYFKNSSLSEYQLSFHEEELNDTHLPVLQECEIICGFIYSKINKMRLEKLPGLKMIATRSTGYDHIDLKECSDRRIVVSTVPHYGENTVAEHTFALILDLSRNIHRTYLRTVRGNFSQEGLEGFDLKGKTIGLVGCGHIGIRVVMIARGFGMKVLVFDPSQNTLYSELLNFEYTSLEDLLARSDIVSLHAPYNDKTHHLIGRNSISKMKKGAILINTSRGGLIDTDALIEGLDTGHLGGAGLDVLEGEDLIKEEWQLVARHKKFGEDMAKTLLRNHLLLNREDVIITPHNAFNSKEARIRILDTTIRNIECFLKGRPVNIIY